MQSNFVVAADDDLKLEGGYVWNKSDPGGPTNLGITLAEAKAVGIDVNGDGVTDIVDIKLLRPADAIKVYKTFYWDKVAGDRLPSGVDFADFDFAINSGPARAAIDLQEVLAALRIKGVDAAGREWPIGADGRIGDLTISAAARGNAKTIINALCDKRLAFLRSLSTYETFGPGWESRVKQVQLKALMLADQPVPLAQAAKAVTPTIVTAAKAVLPTQPAAPAPALKVTLAPVPAKPLSFWARVRAFLHL